MSSKNKQFTVEDLKRIDEADDLHISPKGQRRAASQLTSISEILRVEMYVLGSTTWQSIVEIPIKTFRISNTRSKK